MTTEDGQVQWVIDTAEVSDDEIDNSSSIKIKRKIPKYNEPDLFFEKLEKKFNSKLKPVCTENSQISSLLKEKSVLGPGLEQQNVVPTSASSRRALKRQRKKERDATKGPGWFNLPAQEVTEEIKNDLDLLRMRSILDPRHFYKKNDITHVPKYFQIGTVLETPADFYSGRIPKAQRKKSLVNELLADAESRGYQKKKFKSIVDPTRNRRKGEKSKTKPAKKK